MQKDQEDEVIGDVDGRYHLYGGLVMALADILKPPHKVTAIGGQQEHPDAPLASRINGRVTVMELLMNEQRMAGDKERKMIKCYEGAAERSFKVFADAGG